MLTESQDIVSLSMKACLACLLGVICRFDCEYKPNSKVIALAKEEGLIPLCPEQLSGLPTPRARCEIQQGTGVDVLSGKAKIVSIEGEDRTQQYIVGANEALRIIEMLEVDEVIVKSKSPSCGCGQIFDGTFSKTLRDGDGVFTALLKQKGIKVRSEKEL